MTPASSDRYQSRLFRFVYKQSRRFTQQCDRAFRNLKSTANWVAAVGLYPIFLLLQSRRSTANQVHQAVEATLRQLPAEDKDTSEESPTVDTPIRQVLLYAAGAAAESRGAKERSSRGATTVNRQPSSRSVAPAFTVNRQPSTNYQLPITTHSITGIASQLSSRNLVLVTAHNQALDVLDPQQQKSLQDQIISAIAAYWQYRQRQNQSQLPTPVRAGFEPRSIALSEDLSLNPPLQLPTPVRAGFEPRSIALSEDLSLNPPLQLPTPRWLTSLDRTVAEVESHHLVKVKSAAIAFSQRLHLTRTDRPVAEVQTEASNKTHTTRILSLIWAAIDYFFGRSDRATIAPVATDLSRNGSPHLTGRSIPVNPIRATRPMAHLPASNPVDEDFEDPWLTASDLFGAGTEAISDPPNPPYKGGQQSTPKISRQQNRGSKRISPPFSKGIQQIGGVHNPTSKRILPPFTRGVGGIETTDKRISPPNSQQGVGEIDRANSAKIHPHNSRQQSLQKTKAEDSSVQSTPDWIETSATLMGYVKHPLEQILAWLDRLMLWLEETLLKFWQWLQKMWRKL